jgi:hypothetical protein
MGVPSESHVTFELETHGDRVLLVLTHRRLDRASMPKFGAGWHTHLGILLARLSGAEPEPFHPVFQRVLAHYESAV